MEATIFWLDAKLYITSQGKFVLGFIYNTLVLVVDIFYVMLVNGHMRKWKGNIGTGDGMALNEKPVSVTIDLVPWGLVFLDHQGSKNCAS
jgi:hypothetical protein